MGLFTGGFFYEPEIEDEPLAMEYREAEAGTLPVTHLPPGPVTPTDTPVPILYSDALCGRTQDFLDMEYCRKGTMETIICPYGGKY